MFEPYIKPHGIGDLRFFYANEEARAWYDPLKPYTLLEYEWVINHINMKDQFVIDAGCHHGNYSLVFKGAKEIYCIDCNFNSIDITWVNLALNEISQNEFRLFLGLLKKGWGASAYASVFATIYKMDIEGTEFQLFPDEISEFPNVHTWIVEIHPNNGDPNMIATEFLRHDFELLKVDRERMVVRPYVLGERWLTHATLIARKAQQTHPVIGLFGVSMSQKIADVYR